jgi:serine/threonine-protein kinase
MEYVEGRELKSFFDANERFPVSEIARIMGELLDALQFSHSHGVVHRDIKPANIILLADGTVKVADFGIARIESSTLTQVGTVLGSPSYMSPEQFMGQTVDGRSDLYSAAVVLYQLLTGEVPFTGSLSNVMHRVLNEEASPPSVLNVQVPLAFDGVLRRAMAKRPDERYQSALELKQAILDAASNVAATGTGAARGIPRTPTPGSPPPHAGSRALRLGLPVAAACLLAAAAAAYFLGVPRALHPPSSALNGAPAVDAPATPAPGVSAGPPTAAPAEAPRADSTPAAPAASIKPSGTTVISAVGLADPHDPRSDHQSSVEGMVWGDARRQLIAKAAALYVDPRSINANYALLRTKLLAHSDDYITSVLDTPPPQISQYGLMVGTMRATVNVRDVQKALNRISHDDRVEFVRNTAFPRIAVSIASQNAEDDGLPPQRSAVAENVLKERIRSFGFPIVDEQSGKSPPDFRVDGEVRFKKLSARLPASGLTIEKFVLTSWTLRAVDAKSGEEIYHDTTVPEKKSWASQELALQEVGRLIGEKFSKSFFLEYYDFGAQRVRLRFTGLPPGAEGAVLPEINAALQVLNAGPVQHQGGDVVIDTDLSGGGGGSAGDLVQGALLASLNRKLGKPCFSLADAQGADVHVVFDAGCASVESLKRLETLPPEGLIDAPALRIEDVVKDPNMLNRTTI